MAATGREPKGDRDRPAVPNVITAASDPSDSPKSIDNAITCAKYEGQLSGGGSPQVANTITKAKDT